MKAKEFMILESLKRDGKSVKPRNPVAKNSGVTASAAGKHKDRKAAAKRGEVKHKGQAVSESQVQTRAQIQSLIDQNKKLLAASKSMNLPGMAPTIKNIERVIADLESKLQSAPTTQPAAEVPSAMPKGYKYEPYREEESDGENVKIFHYVTLPSGQRVSVPFSPYQEMTGKDVERWVQLGMPTKAPGGNFDSERLEQLSKKKGLGEEQVSEVSKDNAEIMAADKAMSKIIDRADRKLWTEYTPEEIAEIQKLAKVTGRAHKLYWTNKIQGWKVGSVLDRLAEYSRIKQRDSGQLPDFTGRASTAQDMAKQIALHTDGRYSRLGSRTWSTGYGKRYKDPVDYISYNDKSAYDDAWGWVQSKGKQVHYRDNFDSLQTAIQIGRFIVEPASVTRAAFSDKPETEHRLSVRSAKSLDQWSRKREEITDQQAAALKDIADTKNANAMDMIRAIMNVLDGEKDVKQVIDQSSKVDPRDKAKLDKIISSAGDFKEGLSEVDMSSPEFQQLLKSVGEKAKQGPKKTVYDPRTGKYKVVPVNTQGNKNG